MIALYTLCRFNAARILLLGCTSGIAAEVCSTPCLLNLCFELALLLENIQRSNLVLILNGKQGDCFALLFTVCVPYRWPRTLCSLVWGR